MWYDPLGTTVRIAQKADTLTLVPTGPGSNPGCSVHLIVT